MLRLRADVTWLTETSSNAIDSLLEATQAYQDEAAARRKAEEEAKAPPKRKSVSPLIRIGS